MDMTTCPTALTEPDCIGPVAIPHELARKLNGLAAAEDNLTPFWVCATELVRRWSRGGPPICVRVIRDQREAVAAPTESRLTEPQLSHGTALRTADRPSAADGPRGLVDVIILISADGERMYLERTNTTADGPGLELWARSYLELLGSLADRAGEPVITRFGADDGAVPLTAS